MKKIAAFVLLLSLTVFCLAQNDSLSNARVRGRNIIGTMPRPSCTCTDKGVVVVPVYVDQFGTVQKALPGVDGTTITDKEVWSACRKAAMSTKFNMDANSPALQEGIVVYPFAGLVLEKHTPIKQIVERETSGIFTIQAQYVKTYDQDKLLFSVEQDGYIIPIRLIKQDLGAVKRFSSFNLHKGDTLVVNGKLSGIRIDYEEYKGLVDASIEEVKAGNGEISSVPCNEQTPGSFQLVEDKPSFKGGDANEFSKWVNQHLIYPKEAKESGTQGKVMVQFTIKADGSVSNVKVLKGVSPELDREAIRVVSSSPKWKPGKQRDKPVAVTYTFPVIFRLR